MKITLPDYKKIASQIEKKEVKLTPEEIEKLRAEKERIERERTRSEILEKIIQESEVELSQQMITTEQEQMLAGLKVQVPQILGISFEDYLKKINKTEKDLSVSFLPEAQKRVKNLLVLKAIGEKEKIEASEEEINKEMDKILQNYPDTGNLDRAQLKEYTKEVILNEKTFQLLESFIK